MTGGHDLAGAVAGEFGAVLHVLVVPPQQLAHRAQFARADISRGDAVGAQAFGQLARVLLVVLVLVGRDRPEIVRMG